MTPAPIKTVGNTLANQKANIWIWVLFSAVIFTLMFIFSERELRDFLVALLLAAILLAFFGSTFLFRLQFDTDTVSHLFLGRILISRKPVSDLKHVDIGNSVGAKLTFFDGTSIRFLGADIRLLQDMCRYIEERWPGQVEMRSNLAVSALLVLDRKPRKDA
jgi:hypothetical protein